MALRLANRFEEYGVACAKSISDHNLAIQTGGHAGQNVQFIIDAPELIDSDAYKYFDKTLYDRILQFSQDRALAEMGAMFLWDVTADHDEIKDAMLKGTAKMGALASTLAKDIRQSCSLPARALSFGNTSVEKLFEKAVTALD